MRALVMIGLASTLALAACSTSPAEPTTSVAVPPAATVAPGSQEDLVANIGDRVFFAFDQSILNSEGQQTLDRQASWLARYPQNNVMIAGNCDERGTEEYNIVLGNRRAVTAAQVLQAKGVSGSRITTISYGKDRPTALGSNEAAWAQNRNAITSVK
jgi:peptidoglycan-associated lipoprotein